MSLWREKLTVIVAILKKRFPNLSAEEVISLGCDILEAVEAIEEK